MIDVKKLITGFLILATAAVCSGLIFSLINFTPATTPTNTTSGITIGGDAAAANTANAFLPTEAQINQATAILAPNLASSSMIVSSTDPSNLTDVLATNFVNSVVSANPNGPTGTDTNGNPTFNTPNVTALAASIAQATSTKDLAIPNWDAEVASIPVTVIASNSSTLTSYGSAMHDVLNNHLNSQVQAIVSNQNGGTSASDISYVAAQVQSALKDAAALKTPAAAVAYQKSLLADLVYQKNLTQLYALAQTDPVKASIIFQEEDQKFSVVQQKFLNQAQDLESKTLSFQQAPAKPRGNILLSFIANTFTIPQAHALWPVFDPATWAMIASQDATQIADQLENILRSTLLQILKNTLIAIVQKKVLSWVQGSGAPRFITNWGTTLVNAAQTNAINALNKDMQSSCVTYSAFSPQVTLTLKTFYTPSTNNACANQFAAALGANSLQSFYGNFKNGGFVAFGASTLPSGNPYGATFFEAQKSDLAFHNQQAATALQTQTSQGFTGDQICDDGSSPSGSQNVCEDANGQYSQPNANGQCNAGEKTVSVPNGGLCADGTQPIVTTPSAVTGFTLQNTTGATTQQISAANDIVGLLNSVLSSLVLGLANSAVNAAGKLVDQTLTGINPASITAGAASPPPAQLPLACNPASQTILSPLAGGNPGGGVVATSTAPASLTATGGTLDASNNPPTYSWADSAGTNGTGASFSDTFINPGTYTVTLNDSTGDNPATCTVIQQ